MPNPNEISIGQMVELLQKLRREWKHLLEDRYSGVPSAVGEFTQRIAIIDAILAALEEKETRNPLYMHNWLKADAVCYDLPAEEIIQALASENSDMEKEINRLRAALEPEVAENWTPTAANINDLPKPVRKYVHDLETNCDPAGMVQENICLRENVKALEAALAEPEPVTGDKKQ